MPDQGVAHVRLTDLTGSFAAPWEVEIVSLTVNDRLGLLGDTAMVAFDRETGPEGWALDNLLDFPRSVRADISLGVEGGPPAVEHGPYYIRRGSGTVMESGGAYSVSMSRASVSADLERILRATMVRQFAFVLGSSFLSPSPFVFQVLSEQQGFDGLVNGLLDLGLGTVLAPLTSENFGQLRSFTLQSDADTWDDSQAAVFLANWRGTPIPFLYRLVDLFTERMPDRRRSGYGVNLFDSTVALDLSDYDLVLGMPDMRRRNSVTENQAGVRYTLKGDDALQRSELQQAGRSGVDVLPGAPLAPGQPGQDLLPPTVLSGEFPDGQSADLAVYGRAAQQSLEAISASAEVDWNPYLRNGQVVVHSGNRYRLVELGHDLEKLGTSLTMVPLVGAIDPF